MENENIEQQDAINLDEELELEPLPEGGEEAPEPQTKTYSEDQFKQVIARAKKAEEELKKLKQPQQLTAKKEPDDIHLTVQELKLAEKKRQFGYEHSLSPDEVDAVFKINQNPTKEDLDNPFVKGGIDALRAKKRVESNTPSPSSKIFKVGGKAWGEMTSEERDANWSKRQQFLKGN